MISRRAFLLGVGGLVASATSGLILPGWLVRAERYVENARAPYLAHPLEFIETLSCGASVTGVGQATALLTRLFPPLVDSRFRDPLLLGDLTDREITRWQQLGHRGLSTVIRITGHHTLRPSPKEV